MSTNDVEKASPKEGKQRKPKGVALLSGGLDSTLAVKLMLKQGIEVEAIAIKTPFCDYDCGKGCGHRVKEVARDLNIPLKTVFFGKEYLKMLKRPKYGFGSGMNPCIDCRSMMYGAAKEHMMNTGADFIITGEVLHQRPMSQKPKALKKIEEETSTEGIVLRPLSAKSLSPTEVEKEGWVNREELCNITGRSRKTQLSLAKKFGILDAPNAAGGCLLTDPQFSKRIRDLMQHLDVEELPKLNDIELLKIGRHFRLSESTKLVIGRNELENFKLRSMIDEDDILIEAKDFPGPIGILRANHYERHQVERASRMILRYSDSPRDSKSEVTIFQNGRTSNISAFPMDDRNIENLRI
jgi:tRNA U34 2-thiouridine synthase MnmA/TrmU